MTFDEILGQVLDLDDTYLEDLKVEIVKAQQLAVDEDGEVLVWQQTPAPTPPQTAVSRPSRWNCGRR